MLPSSLVERSMRELTDQEGFPPLGPTRRGVLMSDTAPRDIARAMVEAIRSATLAAV